MSDLIDRQAAIDALNEYFARIGKLKRRGLTKGEKAISLDTVGVIKTLPSAQPDLQLTCNQFATDCISRQPEKRTETHACDYERAVEQLEHDMLYEPTFNQDDGSM